MKSKLKICGRCNKETILWKSKSRDKDGNVIPGLCKDCATSSEVNVSEKKDKPVQKRIKPVSERRAAQLKLYRKKRDSYFKEHPICEYPKCNSREIQLHHMMGRIGHLLTDERFFKSLCDKHHRLIETHPEEAKRLGLSANRLDKQ